MLPSMLIKYINAFYTRINRCKFGEKKIHWQNYSTFVTRNYYSYRHGRWKVHDYFLLLLCKSSNRFTEKHIFKIIIYSFNTSKCAANYVISFEVYDGFIGQNFLKLWRQESWPFGTGWSANIMRIHSWTFCLLCYRV